MAIWQPYLIALVIGLLVGLEREKSHPGENVLGIRTFLLISLLGSFAGGVEQLWIAIVLTVFALGLIALSYYSQTSTKNFDRGLTTEFAAAVVFCLGYSAHRAPTLSAVIGPVVALILFSKPRLHHFSRVLKRNELEASLLLFLGAVVVLNLLPDRVIDPWGVLNPQKFGYLVLVLAGLEFGSYVAVKVIGTGRGTVVVGFLGGFVSSTAVLLSSARRASKSRENWRILVGKATAAKLAAILEVLFIVIIVSPELLKTLALPLCSALLAGAISLFFVLRKQKKSDSELEIKSPLEWKGVLRLSIILAGILALISIGKIYLGEQSILVLSFFTGLFELHGVTLANSTVHSQMQLSTDIATKSIIVALMGSLFAKIGMSWIINRTQFSQALTSIFVTMAIATALTAFMFTKL